MKAPDSKIDFLNDSINIFGNDIHLRVTTSGYYAITLNEINLNLKTSSLEDLNFVEKLIDHWQFEEKSKKENKYSASKLHKQIGHPKVKG